MSEVVKCSLCGEPMPPGEQMFKLHGFSGPCPKPPKPVTENIEQLVCPYCGYTHTDSWEYRDNDGEAWCGECEKKFNYSRNTSVTYTTTPCDDSDG